MSQISTTPSQGVAVNPRSHQSDHTFAKVAWHICDQCLTGSRAISVQAHDPEKGNRLSAKSCATIGKVMRHDERMPVTGDIFGMRAGAIRTVWIFVAITCAIACALAAPSPALAQNSAKESAISAYASASPPANPTPEPPAASAPLPDENTLLDNALTYDPNTQTSAAPVKSLRMPSLYNRQGPDIKRTDRLDGSSSVVMKQPLPIDWDAKVGADLGRAPSAQDGYRSNNPFPGSRDDRYSGAAWASVGVVPNLATLDARVDPGNEQGKLGTTFKRSMPLGDKFSVTLQNSYSVTETFSASSAAATDIPLMATPAITSIPTPQVWGSEKAAKFDILPTGTTFGAGVVTSSTDPATHHTLSAEQKLYGPLHVTTAVTDVGQTTSSKSISAGFKLNW
jgi:hypothetical protein